MTAEVRYLVQFTERDIGSLLDMLRYDQARVETWDRSGEGRFTVTLRGSYPTVGRWESFSLFPRDARTAERLR